MTKTKKKEKKKKRRRTSYSFILALVLLRTNWHMYNQMSISARYPLLGTYPTTHDFLNTSLTMCPRYHPQCMKTTF